MKRLYFNTTETTRTQIPTLVITSLFFGLLHFISTLFIPDVHIGLLIVLNFLRFKGH